MRYYVDPNTGIPVLRILDHGPVRLLDLRVTNSVGGTPGFWGAKPPIHQYLYARIEVLENGHMDAMTNALHQILHSSSHPLSFRLEFEGALGMIQSFDKVVITSYSFESSAIAEIILNLEMEAIPHLSSPSPLPGLRSLNDPNSGITQFFDPPLQPVEAPQQSPPVQEPEEFYEL